MGEELSLSELARAIWSRRRQAALIVFACVVAAGVVTRLTPKIYRAQTTVFFPEARETAVGSVLAGLGVGAGLLPGLAELQPSAGVAAPLCKGIAESYSVRAEICRRFDLQQRFGADNFQDAAKMLGDATWVDITPEGLLVIRVDTTDRQLSADIANACARSVERRYRTSSVRRASQEQDFLESRAAQATSDLRRAEADLAAYQRRAAAVIVPEEVPPILQKLADARIEQAQAEVELDAMQRRRADAIAQLNQLAAERGERMPGRSVYAVPWELSVETVSDNPDLATLRADLVSAEVKLAAARHSLTEEHPDVKRLQTQVDETRRRLAEEARKTITAQTRTRSQVYAAALGDVVKLETDVLGQEARAQGLTQLVGQMEGSAATLPQRLLQYSRLEREVRAREAVYGALESQLEAAKLKVLQDQPVFEVLDIAVPPARHDRPKMRVNLAVAFVVGVFLAAVIAAAQGPRKLRPAG